MLTERIERVTTALLLAGDMDPKFVRSDRYEKKFPVPKDFSIPHSRRLLSGGIRGGGKRTEQRGQQRNTSDLPKHQSVARESIVHSRGWECLHKRGSRTRMYV